MRVSIRNELGVTVFDGRVERMALPEAVIASMCAELFNDLAPSEGHRAASARRAFDEIELLGPGRFMRADLSERLSRYFSGYDAYMIHVGLV